MTDWARLTWQAADPAARAADLAGRLGIPARPGGLVPGAWVLDLGAAELEVRPWQREGPADRAHAGGRLVFEPLPDAAATEIPGSGPAGRGAGARPRPAPGRAPVRKPSLLRLVGVGWSTVELDRAEAELGPWLAAAPAGATDGVEPHLGARTRSRGTVGLPGDAIVLLEPSTEGRLAGSLARDGEGPCVLYLRPAAGLGPWLAAAAGRAGGPAAVSSRPVAGPGAAPTAGPARARRAPAILEGPFGPSVLLLGSPVAGPFLVLVSGPPAASPDRPPGTIDA